MGQASPPPQPPGCHVFLCVCACWCSLLRDSAITKSNPMFPWRNQWIKNYLCESLCVCAWRIFQSSKKEVCLFSHQYSACVILYVCGMCGLHVAKSERNTDLDRYVRSQIHSFLLHFLFMTFSYLSPDKWGEYLRTCTRFSSLYEKPPGADKLAFFVRVQPIPEFVCSYKHSSHFISACFYYFS